MAGGGAQGRELDRTPTWAVAAVCAVIVLVSIGLEKVLHKIGEVFQEKRKKALYEALEKIKGELMVLGFISLILTFGQNYISEICIPTKLANTMLPCAIQEKKHHAETYPITPKKGTGNAETLHRRLLWNDRRILAAGSAGAGCKEGFVSLISSHGLHQLHIFIFFLAVFHVIQSCITMTLGRLKIRGWKEWERQTVDDEEFSNDPSRFRLTHEISFVKDHSSAWTKTAFSFYFVCFFRQFFRSVRKADYLTMRHGFVTVHLAPGSKFDFQKYIKRSLEDDFKVVVGISPLLWGSVVIFLLINVSGWHALFWESVIPLVIILAVGTKLQAIITQMALEIQERHAVVVGMPLVQVSDRNFWFSWPELILYLIHFVLFQNAFELTYFFWIWYEFGLRSCFHQDFEFIIIRVAMGFGVQILCSYITLPLYALVTQMGSTMKRSIFDEQTSKALKHWHMKAQKKKNDGKPVKHANVTLGGSPGRSPMQSPTQQRPRSKNTTSYGDREMEETLTPKGTIDNMTTIDLQSPRNVPYGKRDLLTGP